MMLRDLVFFSFWTEMNCQTFVLQNVDLWRLRQECMVRFASDEHEDAMPAMHSISHESHLVVPWRRVHHLTASCATPSQARAPVLCENLSESSFAPLFL